jgi:hypothetical protein
MMAGGLLLLPVVAASRAEAATLLTALVVILGALLFFLRVVAGVVASLGRIVAEDVRDSAGEFLDSAGDEPGNDVGEDDERAAEDPFGRFMRARGWYVRGELAESTFREEARSALGSRGFKEDVIDELVENSASGARAGDAVITVAPSRPTAGCRPLWLSPH